MPTYQLEAHLHWLRTRQIARRGLFCSINCVPHLLAGMIGIETVTEFVHRVYWKRSHVLLVLPVALEMLAFLAL